MVPTSIRTSNPGEQIKDRSRVKELAEVFTAEREVSAMMDLLGPTGWDIGTRVLEPACGNGNFLEEILRRKLATVAKTIKTQAEFEYQTLRALTNTYGIDIDKPNVVEARIRLHALVVHHYSTERNTWQERGGFLRSVDYVLSKNIVRGDSLNGAGKIVLVDFTTPKRFYFGEECYTLGELEGCAPREGALPFTASPFKIVEAVHYLELGHGA
jgi:hypothetical protein